MARKKERGNGDGDVWPRRNKEGKIIGYRGSYWVHTINGPKRRYVSGKNKSKTRAALNKARADADRGTILNVDNKTLGEYLESWLEDSVKGSVGHRTYHSYRSHVRHHIDPALGSIKLKALSPAHIQNLYRLKLDAGLSASTVRYTHAVLHRALGQALRWELIPRNACEAVDPPKLRSKEVTPLDPDQSRAFLDASSEDRYAALYVVAVTCGLRQGELLGLLRKDIDLEARTLRVYRQLQRMRDGSGLAFTEPKDASRRTIRLPARTAEALGEHLERQQSEAKRAGALYRDQGLVFASEAGTPIDAQNLVNRSFKPLLRRAELPSIRFHDLRHTCATLLLVKGVHPKFVQNLLGHKSINITLDLYSHWMPDMGDFTADAMNNIL